MPGMKKSTIYFAYGIFHELVELRTEQTNGWTEMHANNELMVRAKGGYLKAVPMEEKNDDLVL